MKWRVAKYGNPYFKFVLCICASKCTHRAGAHTNAAAPGEKLWVRCLAQGSQESWYWRWRERWLFTPPPLQSLPDLRLELATFGLQVQLSIHEATTAFKRGIEAGSSGTNGLTGLEWHEGIINDRIVIFGWTIPLMEKFISDPVLDPSDLYCMSNTVSSAALDIQNIIFCV